MDRQSFDSMRNGYNRYQVDDYVIECENQLQELSSKLLVHEKIVKDLKEQLNEKQLAYEQIQVNLEVKEKAADEIARIAMKEANRIVDTAKQNADTILKESLMMARGILLDIARIGNEANEMKDSMKEELRSLMEALDGFETPQIPEIDVFSKG